MARTAAPQDEPDKPQTPGGPITAQKIADGSITAERIAPNAYLKSLDEIQELQEERIAGEKAGQPKWVRVTVPDYPNVTHLLFHDDGRVTWK